MSQKKSDTETLAGLALVLSIIACLAVAVVLFRGSDGMRPDREWREYTQGIEERVDDARERLDAGSICAEAHSLDNGIWWGRGCRAYALQDARDQIEAILKDMGKVTAKTIARDSRVFMADEDDVREEGR